MAAVSGDLERAGRLFGAAEIVRERKGLMTGGTFSLHGPILERALAEAGHDGTAAFETGRRAGRTADLADMVALALGQPASERATTDHA